MIRDKVDVVIKALVESLLNRYKLVWKHQWETVILSSIVLICCLTNAIKRIWNVVDHIWFSWLDKKAAINLVNDDDKCFQYVVTVALDYEEIGEKFRKSIKN